MFDNLFPENLYQSYIVEGDPKTVCQNLLLLLKDRGEISKVNPDVFMKLYDSFSVADSHKVKEWHSELGFGNGKRICIIGANFINHDAERTLLKIIEEPKINTHFFIVVPNSLILLDTIRSRTHIINITKEENNYYKDMAKQIISLDLKNRLDFINKMIKKYKDTENSSFLRSSTIKLINEIEKIIFEKFKSDKKNKDIQFVLKELQEKRGYLNLPGASVKMILEHIALVL